MRPLLVSILFLNLCSVSAVSLQESIFSSSINVKEFGAAGDGKTDDTDAIRKAAEYARKIQKRFFTRRNSYLLDFSGADGPYPEIVFPAGTYRISQGIHATGAYWRGIGGAEIHQTDPAAEILYFANTNRAHVRGLRFRGGRTQIRLWTNNLNTSRFVVRDCRFQDSSGYAVVSEGYSNTYNHQYLSRSPNWAPYRIELDDKKLPVLKPVQPKGVRRMENSTIILLDSCEFKNCMHAAAVSSDQITIRNCTVLTHPQMNGSAFKLRGQSTVEDTRIRIRVNPANKQAAIAHDSALFEEKIDPHPTPAVDAAILECVRVRMETDGDGVPFVRTFTMPRYMPRGIHLRDCVVQCGNQRENAVVYLEHKLPQTLLIQNVENRGKGRPKALASANPITRESLIRDCFFPRSISPLDQYRFVVGGNRGIDETLPNAMEEYRDPPIPPELLKRVQFHFSGPSPEKLQAAFSEIIDAKSFGITRENPKFNDPLFSTREIQRLLDHAEKRNAIVVFPPEEFLLLRPLIVRGDMMLTSAGNTTFTMIGGVCDLFRIHSAKRFIADNLPLLYGRSALNLYTDETESCDIIVRDCTLRGNSDYALRCSAGPESDPIPNRTSLRVANCLLYSVGSIDTNAAETLVDCGWSATHALWNDAAYFVNRGGRMSIRGLILYQLCGKSWNRMTEPWKDGSNLRLVDNYGSLQLLFNRASGEMGGFPAVVYHCAPGGTILIDGGFHSYLNPVSQRCLLYFRALPELTVLRSVGNQVKEMGYLSEKRLRKTTRNHLPETPIPITLWKAAPTLKGRPDIAVSGLKTVHEERQQEPKETNR